MPGSPLPSPHGGTWCPRLSLLLQIAQCVSRNSFPPPNITWHKNGEKLQPEEKSELDGDGDEELHLPAWERGWDTCAMQGLISWGLAARGHPKELCAPKGALLASCSLPMGWKQRLCPLQW